jgi:hypothetical protein
MVYGYWDGPIEDQASDTVMIEDDEGWGMMPNPDFGCVHHSDNEDTDELLRLAFAWRAARVHEGAVKLGMRSGDSQTAEYKGHKAEAALTIEIDRLHKLEKE